MTEGGHDHEKYLHLGDHSHRFGNHPHNGHLRDPNSAVSRHTV